VLTLEKALTNFLEFTGASLEDGLRLMTANPAAMTGFGDRGSLDVGGAADFVAVDAKGNLMGSVVGGVGA
jgi:N-acetylglucosamine-6-phosphate deacetylase